MISPKLNRWLIDIAPLLVWMALIFWLSSRSVLIEIEHEAGEKLFFKSAHIVTYGVLAWLWWRALAPQRQTRWSILLTAFALTVLYGASDEIHQLYVPGRHGQVVDVVLFDASGALAMVWLIRGVKLVRTFPAVPYLGRTTSDRTGQQKPKKLTQKSLDQASYK